MIYHMSVSLLIDTQYEYSGDFNERRHHQWSVSPSLPATWGIRVSKTVRHDGSDGRTIKFVSNRWRGGKQHERGRKEGVVYLLS